MTNDNQRTLAPWLIDALRVKPKGVQEERKQATLRLARWAKLHKRMTIYTLRDYPDYDE